MMEITPQQVSTRLDEAQIVDVREAAELVDGMIPGAVHIPLGMIPESHAALDSTRPVILVCRSGRRSANAAEHLSAAGFDAHTMTGGMLEWAVEGLPTVFTQTP
ncbi:rhodanese-like domain-containing protein [Cryobacterium psychrophilum]|uniref:Rhodanese-like domain-containing protein n=1 Tax=Cryobacterium psychrophilum TaxID=41988 RepID=A0A4Y8KPY8_9MICO|nr:rhodanese-like domain-containing protein [Cryobacterium psychrophilum]TDW29849.1 rhodanese-related sulfurtransferase [Cryobacterium psychrophilum]TFD76765.1 rhodanese-like domain-containing protein [Cryobacterium psychrophilum]